VEDPMVHKILTLELHIINEFVNDNYRNKGFGMQRFEDDMSRVSIELVEIFAQSSRVFAN